MESEELDNFEQELRQALERRPAPPGLKRRLMARRAEAARPGWAARLFGVGRQRMWAPATAALLLAALAGGGVRWELERRAEQRRGEAVREQVMTALRITGHALDQVHVRLERHGEQAGEGEP